MIKIILKFSAIDYVHLIWNENIDCTLLYSIRAIEHISTVYLKIPRNWWQQHNLEYVSYTLFALCKQIYNHVGRRPIQHRRVAHFDFRTFLSVRWTKYFDWKVLYVWYSCTQTIGVITQINCSRFWTFFTLFAECKRKLLLWYGFDSHNADVERVQ